MTLTEIGRPQISGGYPYKVINSQWVPTRKTEMNVATLHKYPKIRLSSYVNIFRVGAEMDVLFVDFSKEKKLEIIYPLTVMGKNFLIMAF